MKPNRQVAHIWAQGNNETAKGSSFSCEGNTLYSYYTKIGFIQNGMAFLSSNTMTPSTSKHLSHARRAINGPVFYSPAFKYGDHYSPTAKECIEAAIKELKDDFIALGKAQARFPWLLQAFETKRERIITTARKFKVKYGKLPVITRALRDRAQAITIKNEQRVKTRDEKAQAAIEAGKIRDASRFDVWLSTGQGECPYSYRHGRSTDYLTVDGETVKTSQGAESPLDHVKKAVAFYYSRKTESGFTPYRTNGHVIHLGHFTLDSIDETGEVKAGCHVFSPSEIDRFVNKWGLK